METCSYQNRTICSYDLKTKDGIYLEELVDQWKLAASKKKLLCADCKRPVYLAAGPIKEPYFAHFDQEQCPYSGTQESERSKEGKRILYQMLKESYPEADVYARYRFGNEIYCTAYVDINEGFAIDFRLINLSYGKFEERNLFYDQHNINKLYVLGTSKSPAKQYVWYLGQIQRAQGFCVLFDVSKKEFTIYKRIRYQNKYNALCYEEYRFTDTIELFSFDSHGSLCYKKNGTQRTVLEIIQEFETKLLQKHSVPKEPSFSSLAEQSRKYGLNEVALKNAISHIREGKGEFVSEKYLAFLSQHYPQIFKA